ncbi:protein tramtrack, beta isoform-like isoform X2 [Leptopilina heterotoma]|uniref:protein tramtrack, beta isoform-like isoform X2 n=1 Tax=Leptopilina heterotoma TaxID=63436 RepID=UPI001CAA1A9D|nr:protein tramtrack, beta isoform-like isoform X2 [Leptopilina heterotoma]XP_043481883.1 protein tramtrack, beta isoform-like isoform X2 [Leptopilina heterotoma]XP_043481884.1 protein tramtrack, beta isoform-like isoform X2 [Leptopilina heterotoma]XP_043481885.1 protein tramtrack, beta isoform-like isoform X2 [Leptopilina heterotoma]
MKQEPEEEDDILEEGLQLPSPSALGHRVRSHSRSLRAMANPSAVWAHFDLCTNDPLRAQCRICGAVVVRGGANPRQCGTTNLHRHLRVHHGGRLIGRRYHVLQQQREKSSFPTKSRVPIQTYSRKMKNISPSNFVPSSATQQGQQQQQQQQSQQQQPKTLVLKTIPLKVKQVAPTTIKMPPRQVTQPTQQIKAPQQPAEVCLRWNSYHSNMQNSFPSLLDSEQFVDVTLACEGRSLKCHKMILSTCSDYLAELLRENPCQHPIILMKDLKFWEVEALVKFMYRGEVNVAHEKLPQLLNAAEALQIKGLAGPSSQNSRPPLLLPPTKQPVNQRLLETKENRPSTSSGTTPSSPKRAQKRQLTDQLDSPKGFTKIRLQRPTSPESPNTTIKLEPLDIPLSPGGMFSDNNLMGDLHEEEDPGGSIQDNDDDRDMNFGTIDGPSDLTDADDQMEFVPSDFLDQEHDIVEDVEPEACLSERDEESRKSGYSEDCDQYEIDDKVKFEKRAKFEESNKLMAEKLIIKKDEV